MRVETGSHFRKVMESQLDTTMPDDAKYVCFTANNSWVLGAVSRYSGIDCEISVCAGGSNPPMLQAIRRFFYYVFVELNCRRATSLVYTELKHAQRLNRICGFKEEGLLREAGGEGQDVIVMGLLRKELSPRLIWKPEQRKAA